jgi:hypothetical protein
MADDFEQRTVAVLEDIASSHERLSVGIECYSLFSPSAHPALREMAEQQIVRLGRAAAHYEAQYALMVAELMASHVPDSHPQRRLVLDRIARRLEQQREEAYQRWQQAQAEQEQRRAERLATAQEIREAKAAEWRRQRLEREAAAQQEADGGKKE